MRYFPVFLDLRGRMVLLAGGGEQMAQKARLLLRTEARLTVMAAALEEELAAHVAAGRIAHVAATYDEATCDACALVFAASGCVGVDAMIGERVRRAGGIVNVVDRPALCDAITPAIVDRDPLVIAIGTEGAAPVLAREVKTRLETLLEPGLGGLAALAGQLRDLVAIHVPFPARRGFWEWVFEGPPRRLWSEGRRDEVEAMIRTQALAGGAGRGAPLFSQVILPAAIDLLPLRAVQRLQSAGLVFHPSGIGAAALDLARRDADRAILQGHLDPAGQARRVLEAMSEHGRIVQLLPAGTDETVAARLRALLEAEGVSCERIAALPD